MIGVIDYGMGNLRSVIKALERINEKTKLITKQNEIYGVDKLILPGVGHFSRGVSNLKNSGLFELLNEAVLVKKIPILGICLGMQLMTNYSEEGHENGFGWIDSETKKFRFNNNSYKLPHMGWNNLKIKDSSSLLLKEINNYDSFYFVHSYCVSCKYDDNVLAYTNYEQEFVSILHKENIFGCQFHPEKSYESGIRILENFVKL